MAARKNKVICKRVKIKRGPRKGKTVEMCRRNGKGPLVKKPARRKKR